jgi:hypothetical protein
MRRRLSILIVTLVAALAASSVSSANPTTVCGLPGYSYAGLGGMSVASGVGAHIGLNDVSRVQAGHVAAWVGLGGYGAGRNGANAWIQAGIITKAGSAPALYYEVTRPGYKPELVPLAEAKLNHSYRIVVREQLKRAGWWRVYIDGRAVSSPIFLPGSHQRWEATATAESWDGGGEPVCNRFDVAFGSLEVRGSDNAWRPFGRSVTMEAPGYRVATRTLSSFRALG